MSKSVYYFPHDYNARSDPKLQDVLIEHGAAGIGVYWCIIEQMYEQNGLLPLKLCKSIAFALHVESSMVESIVNDFELFVNDGENFWSLSVNVRLGKRLEISEKREAAIEKRWQDARSIQKKYKCKTSVIQSDTNKRKVNYIEDFLKEIEDDYKCIVREWLEYKQERKEVYKSLRSIQVFYSQLKTLSQNNPKIAKAIIEQSMANNWAGIFNLTKTNNYDTGNNNKGSFSFQGKNYGQSTI